MGLGNPGRTYALTRHNLGFLVVDKVADKLGISYIPGKGKWWEASGKIDKKIILLMKPTTYMNNSGEALVDFIGVKNLEIEDILVVFDDADLPPGKIRIRTKGASGGHKGLESIIYQLGTENFSRLRIGIGKEGSDLVDWVLSPFKKDEWKVMEKSIEKSCEAILIWVKNGVQKAMDIFNKGEEI